MSKSHFHPHGCHSVTWALPSLRRILLLLLRFICDVSLSSQPRRGIALGKRPVTTTTDYSPSTDQTTDIQEEGSAQFGTSDQDGPSMETGPLHCPAGDHPSASIVSSSVCSGSAHRGRIRESRGSRSKRSPSSRRWRQTTGVFGAECIRGELLKLDIRVSKRTIQKDMKPVRLKRPGGQNWATFLHNHAAEMWACDFLQLPDLFFRALFAFFIIDLKSPKVIHMNVTRSPTNSWVAQQLREATPYGEKPRYLIRDNDRKFGSSFARVATTSGIKVLRTPYRTPRANAICERFLGSVRRECLDYFLVLHEKQFDRLRKRIRGVLQSRSTASRDQAADTSTARAVCSPARLA